MKLVAVEDGTACKAVFERWMQQACCCLIFPLISAAHLFLYMIHSRLWRVHHLYHMGFSLCPCWGCQFSMLCKCCFEPRPYFGAEQIIVCWGTQVWRQRAECSQVNILQHTGMQINACCLAWVGTWVETHPLCSGSDWSCWERMGYYFVQSFAIRASATCKSASSWFPFLIFFFPFTLQVWESKKPSRMFWWMCKVYWVASLVLWVMCFGSSVFSAWKQLVNLGAKLMELKFSQFLI